MLLARRADAHVKVDGLADALLDGKAACAEVFELSDVRRVRIVGANERPDFPNLIFAHPHHAGSDGRGEELVQTGTKVVAVQVGNFEVDKSEGVGAVCNNLDVMRVRHV